MSTPSSQRQSLLFVTTRMRDHGRLDFPWATGADASLPAIEEAISRCESQQSIIFGGGEPTLRSDFLSLLRLLPNDGTLATDGLALHQDSVVQKLLDEGLRKVQIPLHSARADAHNWLVGIPGAHKRVCLAIKALLRHGVDVHVAH